MSFSDRERAEGFHFTMMTAVALTLLIQIVTLIRSVVTVYRYFAGRSGEIRK
jgi:hypothetical protein